MIVSLDLTKDEIVILQYLIGSANRPGRDPLKDTYELREDEPEDPYAALRTLDAKVSAIKY